MARSAMTLDAWQQFVYYAVCSVLYIQLFPLIVMIVLFVSWLKARGNFLHRLMQTLWKLELGLLFLYDNKTTFTLSEPWTEKHVSCMAGYFCTWKIIQRLYYAHLDRTLLHLIHAQPFRIPWTIFQYLLFHAAMLLISAKITQSYYQWMIHRERTENLGKQKQENEIPVLSYGQLSRNSLIPPVTRSIATKNTRKISIHHEPASLKKELSLDMNAILSSNMLSEPEIPVHLPTDNSIASNTLKFNRVSSGSDDYLYATPQPLPDATYYTVLTPRSGSRGNQRGGASYNTLSPARAARLEFAPTYRSIESAQDDVHFHAFAPAIVAPSSCFRFDIWAFLVHQRQSMIDQALHTTDSLNKQTIDDDDGTQLKRNELLPVRRGALANITIEVPRGFELYDEEPNQVLEWKGEITNAKFQVLCTEEAALGQVLFKSTIVVGSKVMILRSYVFVGYNTIAYEQATRELKCNLEVLPPSFEEIPYDDLEMNELIGKGHFGDAFRAMYKGNEVVVKTVRGNEYGENTAHIIHEFRHEAAVLNMFGHHPNIVPFVGACTDVTKPLSLVTAYLPCGSIEDLYGRQLTNRQKQIILADAAAGILNIHEGGFVHRDIAARNILVDEQFHAKVADFGMCRRVSVNCGVHIQTNHGVGPIKYMAPETLLPPHAFSFKSDVYAFGVLMWETFMESQPFPDLKPADAGAQVVQGKRLCTDSPKIPKAIQKLMTKCFQEDPTQRPTMNELADALRKRYSIGCCIGKWLCDKDD